jgi:NAD(P)-dependent dehydrogenase (short-subunit alcohol dehydrogenase family)
MMTHVVFGGHSPIAIGITKLLSQQEDVYHFSREVDNLLKNQFQYNSHVNFKKFSLQDDGSIDLEQIIEELAEIDPHTVIFAGRFRGINYDSLEMYKFEVLFPIKIIESFTLAKSRLTNVIFLCSPAGTKVVPDQDIFYHVNKASIDQIVRYYSVKVPKVRFNGISPGAFVLKDRNVDFYDSNTVIRDRIKDFIPTNEMVKVEDIALLARFLISSEAKQINGQILQIDGGYRNKEESTNLFN